jgi:ribosomal protein L11 methyltransferase
MKHYFIGIEFIVFPRDPFTEILIAELSLFDFDSFMENDNGVIGYIEESKWEDRLLDQVKILNSSEVSISYTSSRIEQENWNVTWETHFEPIQVLGQVNIKAPFHNIPDLKYNIVIEPKMSFGTGHHEPAERSLIWVVEQGYLLFLQL